MTATDTSVGDRLEAAAWKLERRPGIFVVVLAVIYVILIWPSVNRHLWFDELHTFYMAQAPSLHEFMEEYRTLDLNPPLSFLIVRGSIEVFGPTEFGTRFPVILGYFLGSLGLFVFVKRRVGSWWAATGVGLFWCNPYFYLTAEARPYGILAGFFGLALVSWDRVANYAAIGSERRRALAGVGIGVTGMLLTHAYAPLWVMPFWAAEVMRSWQKRRIDWPLWAVLLVPLVSCLSYWPLIRNVEGAVVPTGGQGGLTKPFWYFVAIFLGVCPALVVAAFLAFGIAAWRNRGVTNTSASESTSQVGFQRPELTFLLAALLPPVLLNFMTMYTHGPFYGRHAFLTVLTVNLLVVLFIAYESRANRLSGMAAALMILGFSMFFLWRLDMNSVEPDLKAPLLGKDLNGIHPELPLVADSILTYLEMDHYENPAVLARLYYLVDPESSIKYTHSNLTEGVLTMQQHFPIRANASTYGDFAMQHRHFMIFGDPEQHRGWLLLKLKAEGAQVTELGRLDTPYPDSKLYEVRLDP